ncbi:hypothetical protein [Alkaliphilus peptidifermentans]|uniref:Uncharacterized protein n=1 Tax=Alkaliphilus peptidifermentans DSM 18978 TaxID=1120976 RepID=A0A1G5FZL4_9FIRM|nr:hypothetical protein [Alkaliphilus peptidifermentans]SCY44537.1 hypothetical protein SAMN03080606_01550 [Alkaliphilus peptidifermentans DSM 18978]
MLLILLALVSTTYIFKLLILTLQGGITFGYHRASYLCGILAYQNLFNKDIVYSDASITMMLSICIVSALSLTSISNHLVISLNIIILLFLLFTIIKNVSLNSKTLPLV